MSNFLKVRLIRDVVCTIPRPIYKGKKRTKRPVARKDRVYNAYIKHSIVWAIVGYKRRVALPEGSFELVEQKKSPPMEGS